MHLQVTKKEMKEQALVLPLHYCEASNYRQIFGDCFAYSAGVYGWACDYYLMKGEGVQFVISEGYSPTSNATKKEEEVWRKIYTETIKKYLAAVKKTERKNGGFLHYEQEKKFGEVYRKKLLKAWRQFLNEELYK